MLISLKPLFDITGLDNHVETEKSTLIFQNNIHSLPVKVLLFVRYTVCIMICIAMLQMYTSLRVDFNLFSVWTTKTQYLLVQFLT